MSKDPITIIGSKLSELEKQIRAETDEVKKEVLQIKYLTLSDLITELAEYPEALLEHEEKELEEE